MLFQLLRIILKIAIQRFFRRVTVIGTPVHQGPVIFASNHPNQAIDPILIGAMVRSDNYFLAKSTLFNHSFLNILFRSLHMIPVYRQSDHADRSKNEESFREAQKILIDKSAITIFPEGTSTERRELLPLKTGAARIALQAAAITDFSLNIALQPISITYADPQIFRSTATIQFHDPLSTNDYAKVFRDDPYEAARQLTSSLEARLQAIVVHTTNQDHQHAVELIAKLFLDASIKNDQALFQIIAEKTSVLSAENATLLKQVQNKIESLLIQCQQQNIPLDRLSQCTHLTLGNAFTGVRSLLGSVITFVPYEATGFLVRRYVKNSYNFASIKLGVGILLSLLWYGTLITMAIISGMTWWGILFIGAGMMAVTPRASHSLREDLFVIRSLLSPSQRKTLQAINQQRESLQHELLQLARVPAADI